MDCSQCRRSLGKKLAWLDLAGEHLYVCRACAFQVVMWALEESEAVGNAADDMGKLFRDSVEESNVELLARKAAKQEETSAGDDDPNHSLS